MANKLCTVESCTYVGQLRLGMCQKHYLRVKAHGNTYTVTKPPGRRPGIYSHSEESKAAIGAKNSRHRQSNSRTHISWMAMNHRCNCPTATQYSYYGGRGITICERWGVFENFLADMGDRPAGMTLDRIDPDGNYEPANCRWATPVQQAQNRRRRAA